jgi:cytochrome c oxidase subunit I+III
MVAMVPFDWQVHDSYFIVAHLHYVLIGGMVFPLFAAFYYWTPMMSRRALSERLGKWVFWLMFAGMHVAFLPMHLTGFMGMPRRVWTYLPGRDWEVTNFVSTVGAFLLGAGILLFLIDLARNFRFAAVGNAGNVYGGGTLEWLPTGLYSTRSIPIVTSREPLWDQPDLAEDVEAGRYFLPGSATGHRETIITSPLNAEPQYLQIMPGPSAWPFFSAVFTAGFFLLLTVQAYSIGMISGVLAILCVLRWLWETDRPVKPARADIGAGIEVPTYVTGPSTHGWWATIVLLIVIGMIFVMALFSYLYLYGVHADFWTSPPAAIWLAPLLLLYGGGIGLALLARRLLAREKSTLWSPPTNMVLAAGALALAWAIDFLTWRASGLAPEASGQGATVYGLIAHQGLVTFIALLIALYVAARNSRGLVTRPRNNSFDLATLFLVYTGAQGAIAALVVRLFPGVV